MSTNEIRTLVEQAGFVLDRQYGYEWNYTINFRKGTTSEM
jgi:hypothetical protein